MLEPALIPLFILKAALFCSNGVLPSALYVIQRGLCVPCSLNTTLYYEKCSRLCLSCFLFPSFFICIKR